MVEGNTVRFSMDDVEDLVYFFMNAPLDHSFSKAVLVNVLCKINGVPEGDAGVAQDVEAWLAKTKAKLGRRGAGGP